MSTEASNKIITLPNLISVIRLLLVPIFVVALVVFENNVLAFILFLVAASTDFLDGAIARSTGQVSKLGQKLDPLVDRVLIITAVFAVFSMGRVPLWVLLVLIARDVSMFVLLVQLQSSGQPKFKVVFIGKASTAINMAGFCSLIIFWPELPGLGIIESAALPGWGSSPAVLGIWLLYLGVVLAWIAGIYYMVRAYKNSQSPQNDENFKASEEEDLFANGAPRRSDNMAAQRISRGDDAHSYHDDFVYAPGQRPTSMRTNNQDTGSTKRKQPKAAPANTGKAQGRKPGILGLLNTPKKAFGAFFAVLVLAIGVSFYGYDGISNYGVIHSGVSVGEHNVGQMDQAAAAELLDAELKTAADFSPVNLFATEEDAQAGINENTQELGHGVNTYDQAEINQEASSWSITLATVDAAVNGASLAQEAYEVGRGGDFLLGRIAASTFGVKVTPKVDFSEDRLVSLEDLLTNSIGTPMQNAEISFDGSTFVAQDGQDGVVVDEEKFKTLLNEAFFSEARDIVVPMVKHKMNIDLKTAQKLAEEMQLAIADPVTVYYGEESWTLSAAELGQVVIATAKQDESGKWNLVPRIDANLLETKLAEVTGHIEDQVAPVNATFVEYEGELSIAPSQSGEGADYPRLAEDLSALLFGSAESEESQEESQDATGSRSVTLQIGELAADFTTEDAEVYDFSSKITEFTIEYWWVEQGTITNIHVASDLINSSIVEPMGIWSFNDTAGECTEESGFVEAKVILGDEYVDAIGGGVCAVASTVYNAVYEAGYPIVERSNHSLRMDRYPLGRDSAIAYPYADLKFENDTDNYLLLTMSYTDYSVTCTLWGVPPGYTIESIPGELIESEMDFAEREVENEDIWPGQSSVKQEGKKASHIEVTRTVYDAEGNVKEVKTFYSTYDETPKITEVAPGEKTN